MAAKLALSGPTTPPLALLDPVRSPALSRNLHSWLREYGGRVGLDLVYRVRDGSQLALAYAPGELLIGSPYLDAPHSEDFFGARLSMVLTDGDKVRRSCYPDALPQLELLPTFWDAYLQIGRCAYDPAHQVHFSGAERFTADGNKRTCLWCGAVQHKKRVERVVVEETWVSGQAADAAAYRKGLPIDSWEAVARNSVHLMTNARDGFYTLDDAIAYQVGAVSGARDYQPHPTKMPDERSLLCDLRKFHEETGACGEFNLPNESIAALLIANLIEGQHYMLTKKGESLLAAVPEVPHG